MLVSAVVEKSCDGECQRGYLASDSRRRWSWIDPNFVHGCFTCCFPSLVWRLDAPTTAVKVVLEDTGGPMPHRARLVSRLMKAIHMGLRAVRRPLPPPVRRLWLPGPVSSDRRPDRGVMAPLS